MDGKQLVVYQQAKGNERTCPQQLPFSSVLLSALHGMPVAQALPAPPPWVMALMHSACVITFTRFLGAAAKTQTSKEHDMNRFFKKP